LAAAVSSAEGGPVQARDLVRDLLCEDAMRALWQDLRFAARLLGKAPGFSAIVLATVAIGIAANATILSVADALFWQRLPVPDASRIVNIDQRRNGRPEGFTLSMADYMDYRDRSRSFDELAAHYPASPMQVIVQGASTSLRGEPMSIIGSVVTANYFDVLGLKPAAGRFILPDEDRVRDRDAVAVISDALWQRAFNRNAGAIGSTLQINGTPFTVIGVAPRGFAGALTRLPVPQVWIPSAMFRVGYRYCADAFARDCRIVWMVGRLKRGVTSAAAQSELTLLAQQLEAAFPDTNRGLGVNVMDARGMAYAGQDGRVVSLLLAAVGVLLLVACANLAGLSIARGLGRRKEIAAMLALGASRARVVQQLLTESVFLAVVGGALGVLLAVWAVDLVRPFYATDYSGNPINVDVRIGGMALLIVVALSIATGIAFGILPAVRAGHGDPMIVLRDEAVASGARRAALQRALVVAQVALSVILLVGASLVARSLQHLYRGEGFDPDHVVVARLRPSLVDFSFERARAYQRDVIERLEALPGVLSAAPSVHFPVFGWGDQVAVWLPGRGPAKPDEAFKTVWDQVGPDYFKTLGVSILDGREFDSTDRPGAPDAAVVNDVLARHLWPGESSVGRPVVVDGREHLVVGVVADGQYYGAAIGRQPYLYVNYWQYPDRDSFLKDSRTHIRVAGDPAAMMPAIRRTLAAVDPTVPVSEDYPLSQRIGLEYRPVRVAATMFVCFGAVAIFLCAIGLYGVLASTARYRTREIAIRLALGAGRSSVMRQVLGQGAALALFGLMIGLAIALAGARLLDSLLYGISPHDAYTFALVPVFLIAVACGASYWPARAAARTEPAAALRTE
jgi:predicted permease